MAAAATKGKKGGKGSKGGPGGLSKGEALEAAAVTESTGGDGEAEPGEGVDAGDTEVPGKEPGKGKRQAVEDDLKVSAVGEPVDGKLQVHVEVPGKMTQAIYAKTLEEMAKSCPPVPGARINKGGKTTRVDPSVVLRLVGRARVVGFVVRQIVDSSLATFVEQKGLNAEKEAKTLQGAEELEELFQPGKPFSFDAEIILQEQVAAANAG